MTDKHIYFVPLDAVWNRPVMVPPDAVIRSVGPVTHASGVVQPVVYFETATAPTIDNAGFVPRQFLCVGTGDRFPASARYVGTVTCGKIMQHVYEVTP